MNISCCYQPWFEMQIQYDETVGCCCYYNHEKDHFPFEGRFDVSRYWNGNHFKKVRGIIKNGVEEGTGCSDCQFMRLGGGRLQEVPPTGMTEKQKSNYLNAVENFNNKKQIVNSLPVRYYLNFGLRCNLRCIMCSQEMLRKTNSDTLPGTLFDDLLSFMPYAESVGIIGGEPFVIPEAIDFIKRFNLEPDLSNVQLMIFTNGIMLKNHLKDLENIKKINCCISIDSVGAAYEYIRKGARWEKVESGIFNFLDRGKALGQDWSVSIASVLMKTSLENLIDHVTWCSDNNLICNFVPISSNGTNNNEDIFQFPFLLDDIDNWEHILEKSIGILLYNHSNKFCAKRLDILKKDLIERYAFYKNNPQLFNEIAILPLVDKLRRVSQKKFMIWGTGGNYRQGFSGFIKTSDNKTFLGFIDGNIDKVGTRLDGFPVYAPERLKDLQPEYIIIASVFRDEIKQEFIRLKIANSKIV